MFTLMKNFYVWQREQRRKEKKATIVILGIDNAGKTTTLASLRGETGGTVAPTWGFNREVTQEGKFAITYYDLGGGKKIRGIWTRYFAEVHGVIFVVDSSDVGRMEEAKEALAKALAEQCMPGKPVLIFANKQDLPQSLSAAQVADRVGMTDSASAVVKFQVMGCTAKTEEGQPIDPNIQKGLQWLLAAIDSDYGKLSKVVARDHAAQQEKEKVEKEEQKKRAAAARAARLRDEENERKKAAGGTEMSSTEGAGVVTILPQQQQQQQKSADDGGGASGGSTTQSQVVPIGSGEVTDDSTATATPTKQLWAGAGASAVTPGRDDDHVAGGGDDDDVSKAAELVVDKKKASKNAPVDLVTTPTESLSIENPRALPALDGGVSRPEFSARLPPLLAPLSSSPLGGNAGVGGGAAASVELPNMIMSPPKRD